MSDGVGEGTRPRFGFGDLTDIEPGPISLAVEPEMREVDRAAERLGFASRQAPVRRRKRQPLEEPTDQLNLRASISDINQFVEWCERNRYSYREGFAELVKTLK
jgi:hypothetical protein